MQKFAQIALISALGLGSVACSTKPPVMTEEAMYIKYPQVQQLERKLQSSQSSELARLAPALYEGARKNYDEALKWAKADHTRGSELAQEGLARYDAAVRQSTRAKDVFEDVLIARDRAIQAGANAASDRTYRQAEESLQKLARQLELGREDKARAELTALKRLYEDSELSNLKRDTVDRAKQTLALALKDDIDDVAPRTLKIARDELELALSTLDANRNDREKAENHAKRSLWYTQRAMTIAQIHKHFEASDFDEEEKILWYQDQLSTVLQPLGTLTELNEPNKVMIKQAQARIATLVQDKIALTTSLKQARVSAAELKRQKEAEMEANRLMTEEARRKQAEDEARFAYVQALFDRDEAEVYRQGDNVLIRAHGFYFPSGQSEIQSSNFALLNKIIQTIGKFGQASIIVAGHTDNRGDDMKNQRLSEDRATKVVRFLTDVGQISPQRLSSVGYGKDRPVASNDTEAGRTANRRVEILIVNQNAK